MRLCRLQRGPMIIAWLFLYRDCPDSQDAYSSIQKLTNYLKLLMHLRKTVIRWNRTYARRETNKSHAAAQSRASLEALQHTQRMHVCDTQRTAKTACVQSWQNLSSVQ